MFLHEMVLNCIKGNTDDSCRTFAIFISICSVSWKYLFNFDTFYLLVGWLIKTEKMQCHPHLYTDKYLKSTIVNRT